jgi:hypothetical protein
LGLGFIADEPLPVGETGVCRQQLPSRGTETQRRLRAPWRATASVVLGGRRLRRAEGRRP